MTRAVFARVAAGRGHYESFYLRAVDPERPRGAWIRHTAFRAPGGPRDRGALVSSQPAGAASRSPAGAG